MTFDYSALGELFPGKRAKVAPVRYRRFASAAEAIQFAIEEMHPEVLNSSTLEVEERRYVGAQIRTLYDAADYPLKRLAKAA